MYFQLDPVASRHAKLYYSKSGLHFHFLAGSRRFPAGWPVWPSDLGYELIMRKVVPSRRAFRILAPVFNDLP